MSWTLGSGKAGCTERVTNSAVDGSGLLHCYVGDVYTRRKGADRGAEPSPRERLHLLRGLGYSVRQLRQHHVTEPGTLYTSERSNRTARILLALPSPLPIPLSCSAAATLQHAAAAATAAA